MSKELMRLGGKLLGLALLVGSTFLTSPSVNAQACCPCDYSYCYAYCHLYTCAPNDQACLSDCYSDCAQAEAKCFDRCPWPIC
jgi:hypothetical protein